ncbi:glucose dehydrogenase [FAD, quinone]-like [Schistocerca americana]|uniref:glucose dehydrogenase [FAD, quinone]-like n=1 Tax=Schistocerca americana TaxID=7009 RepID=UPI001F4F517F|nr:glucose dehydrogenase [FAD, quinone]-like [Schistocerca americana]
MSAVTCSSCSFYDAPLIGEACGSSFVAFMTALQALVQARCDISDACRRAGHDASSLQAGADVRGVPAYDYVVVGAGPAGSALAARLSEDAASTVLLLEAGPEEPTITEIPTYAMSGVGTVVDWNYTTVAQENACLGQGGLCSWPRGKMVGGSGSLNGMMYTRGHRSIFDEWASNGNSGWGYDDVLPYFIKSEHNLNPEEVDEGFHGTGGPMVVQHFPYAPPLTEYVIAAGEAIGYRRGDLNGQNQTGINRAQAMVYQGLRHEPSRSYLRPAAESRDNIEVGINAHVTKVLIDPATKKAYGVQYLDSNGTQHTVQARREVVLSAGAIGSPQLLLLSGVGPADHLASVGVDLVHDLPGVGQNLHNHVSVGVGFYINESSTEVLTNYSIAEFLTNRDGPMSSTGLTQTTGFFLSSYATNGVPDLQVFFDGYSARCSATGNPLECTSGEIADDCGKRYISARPTNVIPLSRGYLRLNSSNPLDYPILQPNYLQEDQDVQVLVDGIKIVIRMTETEALQQWGFQINDLPVDGCEDLEFGSDSYWACVVKRATGAENHQAGTCKMGPASDPLAVVDERLRVHGVSSLRVVDASIFPRVPNSNPTAAIVMAAEKLADMIKEDNADTSGSSSSGSSGSNGSNGSNGSSQPVWPGVSDGYGGSGSNWGGSSGSHHGEASHHSAHDAHHDKPWDAHHSWPSHSSAGIVWG